MENSHSNLLGMRSHWMRSLAELTRHSFLWSGIFVIGAVAVHTMSAAAFSHLHQQRQAASNDDQQTSLNQPNDDGAPASEKTVAVEL